MGVFLNKGVLGRQKRRGSDDDGVKTLFVWFPKDRKVSVFDCNYP